MKDFEIIDENYLAYKDLYYAKCGYLIGDKKQVTKVSLFTVMGIIIGFGITTFLMLSIKNEVLSTLIGPLLLSSITVGSYVSSLNVTRKLMINQIRKEFSELNFNVDKEELRKELEKYEILSSIPKNIEEKQEEHLIKFSDVNFKEMSAEDKIRFLEKEKKFWEQVKQKEDIMKEEEIEQEALQKKIGTNNHYKI